ncbi:MAG: hypothetical protein N2109_02960 [Fimbriimonadales bacterium]|nr:hypothetical protein [Fimbriimonadales bacterium]
MRGFAPWLAPCLLPIALAGSALVHQAPPHAWIEGEAFASASVRPNVAGWGRKELLSEQQWALVSTDDRNAAPVQLAYEFDAPAPGSNELWLRLGYEFARSPFRWRLNGGPWKEVSPDELTSDLMPIDFWVEVAWLKLGDVRLESGRQRLELEVLQRKNERGENNGLLFAVDAIVATPGPFLPNGPRKPGQAAPSEQDRTAAQTVFEAKAPQPGMRASVRLEGLWEVARGDEQLPGPVAEPMRDPPKEAFWTAIPVPSDRNASRPDLMFAHRLWYRTRFRLPADFAGGSVLLRFPLNNLNTTVYVNGVLCGFGKDPFVPFQLDVSKAVRPGENELLVGIRDAWYGYSASPNDPMKLRRKFNLPLEVTRQGFQDLAYPIWNAFYSGILETPELTVTGPSFVQDVFVQPKVSDGTVTAEVQVANGPAQVRCDVVDPVSGQILAALGTVPTDAEGKAVVTGKWENPRLWWPDDPQMVLLRTTVLRDGRATDRVDTEFGFREWTVRGKHWFLNGVRWKGWAELTQGETPEEWLANYRRSGQRFMRMAGVSQGGGYRWKGMPMEEALRWCDRNGVVVRRSGILDGQMIGYMAVENDPILRELYRSEIKMELMRHWLDQMVGQVRAERNHPSIHVWSLENEWLYINCINLYGGLMDQFEAEVRRVGDAVLRADPTRLWMVDGGGAAKDNSYPVHGDHYVYTNEPSRYPALAFDPFVTGGGRGRWQWDQRRPRYIGEDFYAAGINPADYAWIQGEDAFAGKAAAHRGIALVQRMLNEGYRWADHYAFWHLWVGDEGAQFGKWISNAERAVFCREYDWTFGAGQKVGRTLRVFNDSRRSEPLTLTAELSFGGEVQDRQIRELRVPPGEAETVRMELRLPKVQRRTEGVWRLRLSAGGQTVFDDRKPVSVLPSSSLLDPKLKAALPKGSLAVWDPSGRVSAWLRAHGLEPLSVRGPASVPKSVSVLVVGPNALDEGSSVRPDLAALALGGVRVVVLEQQNPLRVQGLPVPVETTDRRGAFAFIENPTHPALDGLESRDLTAWPSDGWSFEKAYVKPTQGARSLVQAHERLRYSPLLEVPVGPSVLLVCQLKVGANLGHAPASRLLANLLLHAATYRKLTVPLVLFAGPNQQLHQAVRSIGVSFQDVPSALAAIRPPGRRIAVVSADPKTLAELAGHPKDLAAFFDAGGTLLLNGLTPEGADAYAKVVGVPHLVRPFRRERTGWRMPRDPLAVGIGTGDIAMLSSERLFEWTSDMWIADDVFHAVVDTDEVASFGIPPGFENIVNGMVSADGWKYIYSFGLPQQKPEVEFRWPKPLTFTGMEWIGNGYYHLVNRIELVFDGKDALAYSVQPNIEPQTLKIDPPRTASRVLLRIADWVRVPSATQNVVGIDNVRLFVRRDPKIWSRVHPVDVTGGIVRYSIGKGQAVLCNLRFQSTESVPENAVKKRNILAGILRNLGAAFGGDRTVVAGAAGNRYASIDLSKQANQFRNQRGWFGDPSRTFADFPSGRQVFGGVPFDVFEFRTSPVPECVMLGGPGVPNNPPESVEGIPVGRKAAALFFVHTARVDRQPSDEERRNGVSAEVGRYRIRFADGQTIEVPLVAGRNIGPFSVRKPEPLPEAAVAWTKPYADSQEHAVAYLFQWNNPRPEVAIAAIDLLYGPGPRFGVPALLAITAVE